MIAFFLFITATFRPPAPTVGDRITIDFQKPVVLDRSEHYEIVSERGNRVVIRTFEPKPFTISGTVGDIPFQGLTVPVRSVLRPKDNLAPAPLKPPIAEPYPKLPFVLIAIAALTAMAAWTAVVLLDKRDAMAEPVVPPVERFRAAVAGARTWSQLADAVREYLAVTTLTTTEVLHRNQSLTVAEILRQGDLEKFSPWGARAGDFHALRKRALELIPPEPEEVAA
ncbi:MAG TPA: hypothetical protein VER58_16345 [Thermoanaerobaculia bacterium]|nr:hypothetical protein [Thermoanaerobaculia bacterium]